MIPGGGGTQRLARLVGRQQALGLLLSATGSPARTRCVSAWHIAAFPSPISTTACADSCADLAGREREAVTSIKRLVYAALEVALSQDLDDEIDSVVDHICGQPDRRVAAGSEECLDECCSNHRASRARRRPTASPGCV